MFVSSFIFLTLLRIFIVSSMPVLLYRFIFLLNSNTYHGFVSVLISANLLQIFLLTQNSEVFLISYKFIFKFNTIISMAQSELDRKNITISPSYLLAISNCVDSLNHFYEQENLQPLSGQYKNAITTSFKNLSQNLQIYSSSEIDNRSMVQAAVLRCKSELQIFCLQKLGFLLGRQSEQLGNILEKVIGFYKENVDDFEKILLGERRRRLEEAENEKNQIIQKLRNQLIFKKEYIDELNQRISDLEHENSNIYQRLINSAKNTIDQTLVGSPRKAQPQTITKIRQQIVQGTSHKTLSAKQVEQITIDIMETKQKQESVKGKHTSMSNFLKTYFRYKFGMKELAEETEMNFREALIFFGENSEKNIFLLFRKLLEEECEEHYFWEQRSFYEKLTKILKRHLNQKDNIPIEELEKMYDAKVIDERLDVSLDEKDIQYILINIYKSSQVDTLQAILNEVLLPRLQQYSNRENSSQFVVPSKKLMNEILNYELQKHLFKIEDIIRVLRQIENERGYYNNEDIKTALVQLKIAEQKIVFNRSYLKSLQNHFLTLSEAIEAVEKIRKSNPKKKY